MLEDYGNASSIHWFGQRAKAGVEKAREQVARLLNARATEIVFTSGGTESDNAAILGIVEAARGERKHVVTTRHRASRRALHREAPGEARRGCDLCARGRERSDRPGRRCQPLCVRKPC